jgi:hypothetical protein
MSGMIVAGARNRTRQGIDYGIVALACWGSLEIHGHHSAAFNTW